MQASQPSHELASSGWVSTGTSATRPRGLPKRSEAVPPSTSRSGRAMPAMVSRWVELSGTDASSPETHLEFSDGMLTSPPSWTRTTGEGEDAILSLKTARRVPPSKYAMVTVGGASSRTVTGTYSEAGAGLPATSKTAGPVVRRPAPC